MTHLVEEDLSLSQDVLELGQLQEVALERLGVLIHFPQLVLQLLEGGLQIDHLSGLRSLRVLAGVQHRYTILFDLLLQVTKLAFHLIATTHLVDKLPLEGINVGV